ncbi:MAG: acyltransferase family protein [Synergistaceae bacterium]|nr:acyltransferase family protein [Synergistaceae bacterium]
MKPARNSSLELLRIIAILLILTFHLSYKSGFDLAGEPLMLNRLWIHFTGTGDNFTGMGEGMGYIGNDIFLLISGFFLIKSCTVKWKHIFGLWLRMLFWSVVIFLLAVLFGGVNINFRNIFAVFTPVLSRTWWFLTYYIALYIFHPFLNKILCDLTQDSYRKFIAVICVTWGVILITNNTLHFRYVIDFICLYSVGGYIRLWTEGKGKSIYILYGAGFMLLNYALLCLTEQNNVTASETLNRSLHPEIYLNAMSGVFNIAASVSIFLGFMGLSIPNNRVINLLASAVTGVYMLHDHPLAVQFWWHYIFRVPSYQGSPYLIAYAVFAVLTVYSVCTIVELCRIAIFKSISRVKLS